MEFKNFWRDKYSDAVEITKDNPYVVITSQDDNVIITEAVFNPNDFEDKQALEYLERNEHEAKLFKEFVMLIHAEFLDLYKDELYYREDGFSTSNCDLLKMLYAAHQTQEEFVEQPPLVSDDWRIAQLEMGEDTASWIYTLVDNPERKKLPMSEDYIAEQGINLYNDGIIRGWTAYRRMAQYREKLKTNTKLQLETVFEEKQLHNKTGRFF